MVVLFFCDCTAMSDNFYKLHVIYKIDSCFCDLALIKLDTVHSRIQDS